MTTATALFQFAITMIACLICMVHGYREGYADGKRDSRKPTA